MECGVFHTTYDSDMGLRKSPAQKIRLGLFLVFLLLFPFFADRHALTLANQIAIATIGAIGLNILVGYTGQISLGQGGFMAVGAYTTGILTTRAGVPWLASIPLSCLVTAVVGVFFGIPSLRLKGLYLALATLAAQEIILWVVTHWVAVTGGVDALVVPDPMLFGLRLNDDFLFYWLATATAGITALVALNLLRTRFGRAFVAVRDQDVAAAAMGVDVFRTKLLAFAVSSFFVGLAGALTAHYRNIVTWERFTIDVSILYLSMIIIGGLGSITGSFFGAAFLTLLPVFITDLGREASGAFPVIDNVLPYVQEGVFGVIIILFLIYEPQGLSKIWRNIKDYFRLWPFSYSS